MVIVDGHRFNSIALGAKGEWKNNPIVNGKRILDEESNWPDSQGNWISNFNYEGAQEALSYKGSDAFKHTSNDYLTDTEDF